MSEAPRFLPRAFLRVYRWCFRGDPPAVFMEAYELLAQSIYWGTKPPEEVKAGGPTQRTGYHFKDDEDLFELKAETDQVLAACARALLRWAWEGARSRRQAAGWSGRADLARARGQGHRPRGRGQQKGEEAS